jgi:hypothetical protein
VRILYAAKANGNLAVLRTLADLGVAAPYIRHPSHGGKAKFAAGVAALVRE